VSEAVKSSQFVILDKKFRERYIAAKIPNCASIIFEVDFSNELPQLLINDLKIDYSADFTLDAPELLWSSQKCHNLSRARENQKREIARMNTIKSDSDKLSEIKSYILL
jgi:hypothetical protein